MRLRILFLLQSLLACEGDIKPLVKPVPGAIRLDADMCRKNILYPGCDAILRVADAKPFALDLVAPRNVGLKQVVTLQGGGFDVDTMLTIDGKDVKIFQLGETEAFFISPELGDEGVKQGQLIRREESRSFQIYYVPGDTVQLTDIKDADEVCQGQSRLLPSGLTVEGRKVCGQTALPCAKDGELACLTHEAFPAADASGAADKILIGSTLAGVSGSFAMPAANKILAGTSYGAGGTALMGSLTLPAAGKVLSGTTFGVAGTGSTGTLTLPLASSVRSSASYGDPGSAVTGTLLDCNDGESGCVALGPNFKAAAVSGATADKILSGQSVAGVSGSVTLPAASRVLTGTSFGAGGNALSGSLTLPSAGNVLSGSGTFGDSAAVMTPTLTLPPLGKVLTGTSYGVAGSGSTGTLTLPTASNVLTGSGTYGDPGAAVTPSYNPDFPAVGNVLSSDTVNSAAGTLTLPAVGTVLTATTYGVAGTGSTGTLTLPGASYVRPSAGTYGNPGSAVTGTLADCADGESGCVAVGPNFKAAAVAAGTGDKILSGQSVAGVSGTVTLPVANKVLTSNSYGVGGTAISGSLTLPSAGNVLTGSGTYGDPLAAITPSLTLPAVGKVLASTSFGASGSGSTGTLTLPTAANVLAGSADYGDAASLTTATYVCPSYIRPATPAISAVTFDLSPDRINVSWGAVSGASGYIVIIRNGSAVTFTPTDGVTYSTGAQGSDTIIYSGSSTSVTYNTDVTAATTYHIAVYSYIANKIYSYLPDTS